MNLDLLFGKIQKSGELYTVRKSVHKITIFENTLNGKSIKKLFACCKFIIDMPTGGKIVIAIKSTSVADDAVIQQLEIALAYLFENGVSSVELIFENLSQKSPYISSVYMSVFARNGFSNNRCLLHAESYLNDYYRKSYSDVNYLRYYISEGNRNSMLNTILQDVIAFVGMKIKDAQYSKAISKAFTEMIDNVRHAESDCIATIKYSDRLVSNITGERVSGYFLNVVDISEYCIFGKLETKIANGDLIGNAKDIIEKSLPVHKRSFGINNYCMERYCIVSVFQNRITTSSESGMTGGTGLTELINVLTTGSIAHNCYVLSGWHVLFFKQPFIGLDSNGNVGFNESGRYYDDVPSKDSFNFSPMYYQGTIFLLEIIIEANK